MEKNYELVAWTRNISDAENARLVMIPSLECEVQADLFNDLGDIHREEYKFCDVISTDLAMRAIKACESISRFKILTGNFGDGVRYLFFAAHYCVKANGLNDELDRLCEKAVALAKKHNREDILQEFKPQMILKLYFKQA